MMAIAGAMTRGRRQRAGAIVRDRADLVPRLFHQVLQVDGDQHLIFDDQDFESHVAAGCSGKVT